MTEAEMQNVIAELKAEVTATRQEVGKLDTEIRVTKHDVDNVKQMLSGFGTRLEKCEERLAQKIEALGERFAALNVRQERGVGYVTGIMAAATAAGAILIFLVKLLFTPGMHP